MTDAIQTLTVEGICDEQTAEMLKQGSSFVQDTITKLHDKWKNVPDLKPAALKEKQYEVGKKLLFLEELCIAPTEIQKQVEDWLKDEKRNFLFTESPQGNVYGELLLANAQGIIDQFRERYNPNVPKKPTFKYDKTFNAVAEPNSIGRELIVRKLNAVLDTIVTSYEVEVIRPVEELTNPSILEAEGQKINEREKDLESKLGKANTASTKFKTDDAGAALDEFYDKHDALDENDALITTTVSKLKTAIQQQREYVVLLRERVSNSIHDVEGLENDLRRLRVSKEQRAELNTLAEQFQNLPSQDTSKHLKEGKSLTYSFELSPKDPLDVRFGNDGGCCIGVYPNTKSIGNAYGLPHMIAENTIYLFNVNQAIGKGQPHRVGIVLAFPAREGDKYVLACNSLELSPSMNPINALRGITTFVEEGIAEFAKANSFDEAVMSDHEYNTSKNYSTRSGKPKWRLMKRDVEPTEPKFYSEITFKNADLAGGFYTLWSKSIQ